MNLLITGTSSGLGFELSKKFKEKGYSVYGISRSLTNLDINQVVCDFKDLEHINPSINSLCGDITFDYVILNAGILGKLDCISNISLEDYKETFNINVFSNKIILDNLLKNCNIRNVIAISSGAALKSYVGWSLYCTSKAAFKQLISSYAQEFKSTHFVSLAPSIFKTKIQDYIYSQDEDKIPSISKFKEMYPNMQSPSSAANKIFNNLNEIKKIESGEYFDIREIK
jgi:NADP-dependent 3-hydroxy acid dehydrogenase YdfG